MALYVALYRNGRVPRCIEGFCYGVGMDNQQNSNGNFAQNASQYTTQPSAHESLGQNNSSQPQKVRLAKNIDLMVTPLQKQISIVLLVVFIAVYACVGIFHYPTSVGTLGMFTKLVYDLCLVVLCLWIGFLGILSLRSFNKNRQNEAMNDGQGQQPFAPAQFTLAVNQTINTAVNTAVNSANQGNPAQFNQVNVPAQDNPAQISQPQFNQTQLNQTQLQPVPQYGAQPTPAYAQPLPQPQVQAANKSSKRLMPVISAVVMLIIAVLGIFFNGQSLANDALDVVQGPITVQAYPSEANEYKGRRSYNSYIEVKFHEVGTNNIYTTRFYEPQYNIARGLYQNFLSGASGTLTLYPRSGVFVSYE